LHTGAVGWEAEARPGRIADGRAKCAERLERLEPGAVPGLDDVADDVGDRMSF
jgi:hypothetical protein